MPVDHFRATKQDSFICMNNAIPPSYLHDDGLGNYHWAPMRKGAALFSRADANKVYQLLLSQGQKVRFEPVA